MNRLRRAGFAVAGLLLAAALAVVALNVRGESPLGPPQPASTDPAVVARGAYLARAGNCLGCHTTRGGADYAGGRGIETPFGTVFAPNLTPDTETGLGGWSTAHFWRALHNGRSRDGRLLSPAFPYPHFTRITRDDSDALFAYLQGLPAVRENNPPNTLRFPFDTQVALAVWRALYFTPGADTPQASRPAEWHRGRYLVDGLGHCAACHTHRDALGGATGGPAPHEGLIPVQNWYAPPLSGEDTAATVALLKTGVSPHGAAMGPMAEVVFRSTQHLEDSDLVAMATYLQSLPPPAPRPEARKADTAVLSAGSRLYGDHCASCHGDDGRGAPPAYPPLAGNPTLRLASPANVIHAIARGGFAPATAGNPTPYGMPPFATVLNDAEIAAVASYVRQSWGNGGAPVSALDVLRTR